MSTQISFNKKFAGLCLLVLAVFFVNTGFAQESQMLQSQVPGIMSVALSKTVFNLNEVNQWPERTSQNKNPCPLYPLEARRKGIEGHVMVKCFIDKNGNVQEAEIVEAMPKGVFDKCALTLVQKYKFKPAMKNGQPVNCIAKLPIKFALDN